MSANVLYVVSSVDDQNRESWSLFVTERITKIARFKILFWVLNFWVFWVLSQLTNLVCIVGELVGAGSVGLAVGVGDK